MRYISIFIFLLTTKTLGQNITEIAKSGVNSTVSLVALDKMSQPLSYGSGFILDDELIVTNIHVAEGSSSIVLFKNNEETKFKVEGYVGLDKVNDLVILKVPGLTGNKLSLGSSQLPEIGERIYAVGNPKGLSGTFSEGIVSGIRDSQGNKVLQITAPISPGSSDGPVLNSKGEVIGVAFASYSSGQNLNFAIPVIYLNELKLKLSPIQLLTNLKPQIKSATSQSVTPNIKEGVIIRNIVPCYQCAPTMIFFSIKNNLPHKISNIKILFLIYDNTGTIVDYNESWYFSETDPIKPYLARSVDFQSRDAEEAPIVILKSGYKVKSRVLDFKIIEQ